ncbi:hypothetical protein PSENEW3_00004381 [Picochlorum sp. SENEW3]|nr:hypothetical protein PSENEW3_00004381 [Picochlorum sp. SENEW3]
MQSTRLGLPKAISGSSCSIPGDLNQASPLDLSFGVSSFISRTTSDSGTSASGTEIRCTKSSISCIQKDMTLVFLEASV